VASFVAPEAKKKITTIAATRCNDGLVFVSCHFALEVIPLVVPLDENGESWHLCVIWMGIVHCALPTACCIWGNGISGQCLVAKLCDNSTTSQKSKTDN